LNTPNVGLDQSAGARMAVAAADDTHDASPSATKPEGHDGTPTQLPDEPTHACPGQQQFTPSRIRDWPSAHDNSAQPLDATSNPLGQLEARPTHALPVHPCPGQQHRFSVSALDDKPAPQPALVDTWPSFPGAADFDTLVVVPPDFFAGAGQHPCASFSDAGQSREHDCASAYVQPDTANHSDTTPQSIRTSETTVYRRPTAHGTEGPRRWGRAANQ
jgi:hypothetical protein